MNFKSIRNSIYIFAFAGILCISCSNDDDNNPIEICDTTKPLENLDWLKEIIVNLNQREAQIIRYRYKGEDVFWIDTCVNCEDALIQIHSCTGEVICRIGGITGLNDCPDFDTEATDKIVLFDNVVQN